MTIDIKDLSDIFGAKVEAAEPILADGTGLCVRFSKVADITDSFGGTRMGISVKGPYANPALHRLVTRRGFLVLENGWMVDCTPSAKLSGLEPYKTGILQDPYHRDSAAGSKVTVLYKYQSDGRSVPTIYARMEDVRQAISTLYAEKRAEFQGPLEEAMSTMMRPDYLFGEGPENRSLRMTLRKCFPDFTQMVANRIPPDRVCIHWWISGKSSVVLHSNVPCDTEDANAVVHGRPHDYGRQSNPLLGLTLAA